MLKPAGLVEACDHEFDAVTESLAEINIEEEVSYFFG